MTSISPQNEELLRKLVATGRFQSEDAALGEAIRLLIEQATVSKQQPSDPTESATASTKEWIEAFHKWTRKPRRGNPNMDDSRESIYGDRGL